jgi:two-component system chemotaxis response regulator CheY
MNEKEKIRVLIADDEDHIRRLLKTIFASMNAEVVAEAKNGQEAVDLYREHRPHIAMLDINMPVMDGKEALLQIKKDFPDALIIMLTSLSAMGVVEECLEAGASNYIRKDNPIGEIKKFVKETWTDYVKSRGK